MISVIIPVYNVEAYLDRCVASILRQSYNNLEIILVNDGSTDSSAQMCDAYAQADTRIRVIHKQNGGLSSARNAGIDIASGEYLAFIDSDDFIADDMLETLLGLCTKHKAQISACSFLLSQKAAEITSQAYDGAIFTLSPQDALIPMYLRDGIGWGSWKLYFIHI
mgnify:CR=1 FL=1